MMDRREFLAAGSAAAVVAALPLPLHGWVPATGGTVGAMQLYEFGSPAELYVPLTRKLPWSVPESTPMRDVLDYIDALA